jgi:hypothetical protein
LREIKKESIPNQATNQSILEKSKRNPFKTIKKHPSNVIFEPHQAKPNQPQMDPSNHSSNPKWTPKTPSKPDFRPKTHSNHQNRPGHRKNGRVSPQKPAKNPQKPAKNHQFSP